MKPADRVGQETAEMLAQAVAEVTRRALKPELQPFEDELNQAARRVEDQVKILVPLVAGTRDALDELNRHVPTAVALDTRRDALEARIIERVEALLAELGPIAAALPYKPK